MACCGQGRSNNAGGGSWSRVPNTGSGAPSAAPGTPRTGHAWFQYVGPTALTAVGGVTGARYVFGQRGVTLAVDPADRRSLAAVPNLRQVMGPP